MNMGFCVRHWRLLVAVMACVNLLAVICGGGLRGVSSVVTNDHSEVEIWQPIKLEEKLAIENARVNSSSSFAAPFLNTSDEYVQIESVTTTCGCTEIDFQPRTIAPGGAGTITGKVTGRSHSGEFHVRATGRIAGLTSGRKGSISLLVTVSVHSSVEIDKTKLNLRPDFVSRNGGSEVLTIRSTSDIEQSISVASMLPEIEVKPNKFTLAPRSTQELLVSATSAKSPASGELIVSASDGETHRVGFTVKPQYPVTAAPERLVLGVVSRSGDKLVSSVLPAISLQGAIDKSEVSVKELPSPLEVHSIEPQSGGVVLTFGLSNQFSEKLIRGDIVLSINTKEMPMTEMRVPVVGVFKE
jgi:P pilus assembly chaperone PapD